MHELEQLNIMSSDCDRVQIADLLKSLLTMVSNTTTLISTLQDTDFVDLTLLT